MLQVRSVCRLDQAEIGLRHAAERHGARILATSNVGQVAGAEAVTFTLCLEELYAPLLAADPRFAAFLPVRVAAHAHGGMVTLETIPPREFCRLLHRTDLERLAIPLEDVLRAIIDDWAGRGHTAVAATPTEDQINMRAALPQRIDCHGSKVEELAGTGVHDAQGG
jgi:uncharacterized protein (DUF302 family)